MCGTKFTSDYDVRGTTYAERGAGHAVGRSMRDSIVGGTTSARYVSLLMHVCYFCQNRKGNICAATASPLVTLNLSANGCSHECDPFVAQLKSVLP